MASYNEDSSFACLYRRLLVFDKCLFRIQKPDIRTERNTTLAQRQHMAYATEIKIRYEELLVPCEAISYNAVDNHEPTGPARGSKKARAAEPSTIRKARQGCGVWDYLTTGAVNIPNSLYSHQL